MADYSKTERLVLLIDLSPLHHAQYPILYIQSLLKSAHNLLEFPPLSQSLSSFKLFFSSLSPLRSSSALLAILSESSQSSSYYNPNRLSFSRSHETLKSLTKTLDLFSDLKNKSAGLDGSSRADFAASSMLQVVQDEAWDVEVDDSCGVPSYSLEEVFSCFVASKLVVLFSPICRSFKDLAHYIRVNGEGGKDEILVDLETVSKKMVGVFQHVNFVARDINISWVDTNYEEESIVEKVHIDDDESGRVLKIFQSGLKSLGWGFSSTSSIILGAAIVPFGLLYPSIGVLPKFHNMVNSCKKVVGHLNLEISDVKGEPLQCKCCELQLLDLKPQHQPEFSKWESMSFETKANEETASSVWESLGDSAVQVDVKTIWRGEETMKVNNCVSNVVLVYESLGESKSIKEGPCSEFFADKVLDILSKETNEVVNKKCMPSWPMLLSFLYRGGYQAHVMVASSNGCSYMGVLKPFTVQSALLLLMTSDSAFVSNENYGGLNMEHIPGGENKRKKKNHPGMYDLSWTSFCQASLGKLKLELEDAYFYGSSETSKKLKFMKCWMKQVGRSMHDMKSSNKKRMNGRVVASSVPQELEIDPLPGQPHAEPSDDASFSDSSEVFFSNLSESIQHGLDSGVDLRHLAQRLVTSSIYWLRKKRDKFKSQPSAESLDGNNLNGKIVRELVGILLKDSTYLSEKREQNDMLSSEDGIREYELQILFRMEILQSDVADGVKDFLKRRFIKQICHFLEMVQCTVQGGFFGDFNLHDYVDRIIKTSYSQQLGEVTHKICEKMDLLLFDYDDESPNSLLNSEESNQNWREKPREPTSDNNRAATALSSEDSSRPWEALQIDKPSHTAPPHIEDKTNNSQRLEEARVKRERARRFSSFTRGVPVLQRVWAPKRPKQSSRSKPDLLRNRRSSSNIKGFDKVCETPMSGMQMRSWSNIKRSPPSSVYKALFRDD